VRVVLPLSLVVLTVIFCSTVSYGFQRKNIEEPYMDVLEREPEFMQEGGAEAFELRDGRTLVVGIGKGFYESTGGADELMAKRTAEINARAALLEKLKGIEVKTERGTIETRDISGFFQSNETTVEGVVKGMPIVGSWWSDDLGVIYVAVGIVLNRNGNVDTTTSVQEYEIAERIRNLEGREPFVTLVRFSGEIALSGGIRAFEFPDGRRILLSVGMASLSGGVSKARRIAQLKAMRALLGWQKGIRVSKIERLVEGEVVLFREGNTETSFLSEMLSVSSERVKGMVRTFPVVATWEDREGRILFLAIGKEVGQ